MSTKVLLSPEQYLATNVEWEPEYVRGEVVDRPMPDGVHVYIQRLLLLLFSPERNGLIAYNELRCKLAEDLYRIPDVFVLPAGDRLQRVPTRPPLVVIEVVSEDERLVDLVAKLDDYAEWGVPNIWVVNPWNRRLAVYAGAEMKTVDVLTLPGFNVEVTLEELIAGAPTD